MTNNGTEQLNNDLISIIVPVFRVEKYLSRCIDSILAQTYTNIEIILVDDGSDDGCPAICDEYAQKDSRIKVIHKENGGQSIARNVGLDEANGEYIGFVDSDDCIHSEMFERLYKMLMTHDADISICGSQTLNEDGVQNEDFSSEVIVYQREEMLKRFFRIDTTQSYLGVWRRLCRRDVLQNVRFPENVINEDVYFSYRIFLNSNRVCETQDQYYFYNEGNFSITRNMLRPRDYDLYTVWNNVAEYAEKNDPGSVEYAKLNYARCDLTLLMKYAIFGIRDFEKPNKELKKLKKRLKSNKKLLLSAQGLTKKRKIAIVLLTISVKVVRFLYKVKILKREI